MVNAWVESLYRMLSDRNYSAYIHWNASGNGFVVESERGFAELVLPKFYSTNKWTAFMRNLGYYSFLRSGGDSDTCEYTHTVFHRDHPERLSYVRQFCVGLPGQQLKFIYPYAGW